MGLIDISNFGNLKVINNSMQLITLYPSFRLDTFFFENMYKAEDFFNKDIKWTKLGYLIDRISNGENLATDWYSVEGDSKVMYLSVSQITEFGLEEKNNSFLREEILEETFGRNQRNISLIEKNMIIVTRSGSPGIAISTNHPSFEYEEYDYVPSGFLIYFNLRDDLGLNPNVISYYLNLRPVRYYLIANSSGRCQRNISQEILMDLPVPEELLDAKKQSEILKFYELIERESIEANNIIRDVNKKLEGLWDHSWEEFNKLI